MDMRVGGGRLLALHDATFSLDDAPLLPQRNVLRSVDLEQQVRAAVRLKISSKESRNAPCCALWTWSTPDASRSEAPKPP